MKSIKKIIKWESISDATLIIVNFRHFSTFSTFIWIFRQFINDRSKLKQILGFRLNRPKFV